MVSLARTRRDLSWNRADRRQFSPRNVSLNAGLPIRVHWESDMKTPAESIAMFAAAAFFGAIGQYLYKSGADRAGNSAAGYLLNLRLLAGVVCYVLVMVLFVAAFKRGGSLRSSIPYMPARLSGRRSLRGPRSARRSNR